MSNRPLNSPEPIAIIGIGCRFPQARGVEEFWSLLQEGRDAITEMPAERFDVEALAAASPGKTIPRFGGIVGEIDRFDADFFGITAREARHMDPQQRLALEVAVEALENAGLTQPDLRRSTTSVFVGLIANEYQELEHRDLPDSNVLVAAGGSRSGVAARISYALGFDGLSIAIDTDRSSSLVAVHLACNSIRNGDSTVALAGATNLVLTPEPSIAFAQSTMLSADGRCKFGDAQANGFVRSDGVAFVVLKKLSAAIADGDRIYATILGSAVNHDRGRSGDFIAPSSASQIALIEAACADANVRPVDVQYVEAHGPGTQRGDVEEVRALSTVFQRDRGERPALRAGSVKTNIGHAEAAAGIAGLIKVALSVWHKSIPASLHFETPNPNIDFNGIVIPTAVGPWPDPSSPLVAGVTSLGLTGTNAHVIVGEGPRPAAVATAGAPAEREEVLTISAKNAQSLAVMAERYIAQLRGETPSVHELAYTASARRNHHDFRLAVVGTTADELRAELESSLKKGAATTAKRRAKTSKLAFVFPGQGSQWLGMGRELLAREPVFRESMERCAEAIQRIAGWSLFDELAAEGPSSRLTHFSIVQPVLVSIEISLAAQWRSLGLEPDVVVGTSMGEVAAAHVAGILSLDDAMTVICRRSQLMHERWAGKSAMAVIGLPAREIEPALAEYEEVWIAGINSPVSTVVAGAVSGVEALLAKFKAKGVDGAIVRDMLSSHTPHVDAIAAELTDAFRDVKPMAAKIPMLSSVNGQLVHGGLDGAYWLQNLRAPILFADAVQQLLTSGYDTFLEVSPHPVLVGPILDGVAQTGHKALAVGTLRRGQPERRTLLRSLAALYAHGLDIDWQRFFSARPRLADVPAYAWKRERYWYTDHPTPRVRATSKSMRPTSISIFPTLSASEAPEPVVIESADKSRPLRSLPPGERRAFLLDHVREHVAAVLGIAPELVDGQRPLRDLGLGSFLGVELASLLSASLGRTLAPTLLFNHPTLEALVEYLAQDEAPVAVGPIGEIFIDTGIISEADLRAALAEQARSETKERLGAVLLRMGLVTAEQLNRALSYQLTEPIAIVGMACRFPGASDPEAFWRLLEAGVDAVTDVPPGRWNLDHRPGLDPIKKASTNSGGFLQGIDLFDAAFFGITPREAEEMDPQQRLFLEVATEALEDAGQNRDELVGSRTGVFVGITNNNDYVTLKRLADDPERVRAHHGSGTATSVVAGRLAYTLGLNGPAVAIDAACASSLTAVHLAMQSLRAGECKMAVVGGVNAILSPEISLAYSQSGMLSPTGRCKTFDESADGYVRGEGCGAVILKRLSDARAHGDNVLAVLISSAVNHNGRSSGLTAPNGTAQEALVRQALATAGVHPSDVGYVEAQGTGTALGDPIEIQALGEVLKEGRPKTKPFVVGSVKTNIGHLEAAAGIAGLMKVVLSLRHQQIPRHLHLNRMNPLLGADTLPMKVPVEPLPWLVGKERRIAGVSAFGFSGANCHVLVEEAPLAPTQVAAAASVVVPWHIIPVSARSSEALAALSERYTDHWTKQPDDSLADVSFTATVGRSHFEERIVVLASSLEMARDRLRLASSSRETAGVFRARVEASARPRVGFLFAGSTSDVAWIADTLYETQPVFAEAFDKCGSLSHPQAALFTIQYALSELWRSWGIVPEAVMGEGVGEYVAAIVAGVMSLADALRLLSKSADVGTIRLSSPKIAVISSQTGVVAGDELEKVAYWQRTDRTGARFAEGLRALRTRGIDTFIEMSHEALHGDLVEKEVSQGGCRWLPSLRSGRADWEVLLESLAELHIHGAKIDWDGFHRPYGRRRVALPTYAWQKQRYWVDTSRASRRSGQETGHALLGLRIPVAGAGRGRRRGEGAAKVFENVLSTSRFPYLAEYAVHGRIVVPPSALLELVRAAAEAYWGPGPHRVRSLVLQSPIVLAPNEEHLVQVVVSEEEYEGERRELDEQRLPVAVYSQPLGPNADAGWVLHAQGQIHRQPLRPQPEDVALDAIHATLGETEDPSLTYPALRGLGLNYGRPFQALAQILHGERKVLARLQPDLPREGYGLHPVVLESGFQALGALFRSDDHVCLPIEIGDLTLWNSAGVPAWVQATTNEDIRAAAEVVTGTVAILDEGGQVLAEVTDVKLKRTESAEPQAARPLREPVQQDRRKLLPTERAGARLAKLSPQARAREIESSVRMHIAKIAGLASARDVPLQTPFRDLGLDSVMVVELRNRLAAELDVALPTTLVFDYPTVARLTEFLLGSLEQRSEKVGRRASDEPIAIIGMSCRFPGGAESPEAFWDLLREGKDAIVPIPSERWDADAFYDSDQDAAGKMYVKNGGFLSKVDLFDTRFFGIAPREADAMDPQQRLLLEVSLEALERAGQVPAKLAGSSSGVFLGLSLNEYAQQADASIIDAYTYTGTALAVASGRIAYVLGWEGPAITFDTACSSSLVALHHAVQSLQAGECTVALAGGANLMLSPETTVAFCRLHALSSDGHCKTFDASANGYVRSDGCGVVVLKRLSDAQAAGDPILAVVRGTAVNQDGKSNGLTAPNGLAQQKVIRRALENARLKPSDIRYVEAHGTGTPLGDPIEVQSLGAVYADGRAEDAPLILGAVKTNIGHTEAAAGIAGLIKTVLSMQARQIPPNLHFRNPTPHIPWSELPIRVPTELQAWPSTGPCYAGISSFGISGTNAHVILESAPAPKAAAASATPALMPLCISAKSPNALREYAQRFVDRLAEPNLNAVDVAFTTSVRRPHHEHRLVALGTSVEEWREKLQSFVKGDAGRGLVVGEAHDANNKIVFVFPGQGSQWLGMGRSLLQTSAVFREHIARCEEAFRPHVDWSLREQIEADSTTSRLTEIGVIQPMIFAIQTGLAAIWASFGVIPDGVVGHSMGEVAASCVAGALSLEDAARVICVRSKLLRRVRGRGAMAAIEMTMAQAEAEIARFGGKLSVAASNGTRSTVVAGDTAAITSLVEDLKAREIFGRLIKVDVASHSSQVDELKDDLLAELEPVRPKEASLRFLSTCVVGSTETPRLDADYWWSNLREPVRLSQRVQELISTGHTLFVEVSPHPVLTVALEEALRTAGVNAPVVPSLRREEPEWLVIHESLATLHGAGYPLDWKKIVSTRAEVVNLPTYPWQRERHWVPVAKKSKARSSSSVWTLIHSHLATSDSPAKQVFELELDIEDAVYSYLVDHKVQGEVWFPAAAFVEMALEGAALLADGRASTVADVTLHQAMTLSKGETTRVQLVVSAEEGESRRFRIASRHANEDSAAWIEHATGRLFIGRDDVAAASSTLAETKARCSREVDTETLYADFAERSISYGPAFQGIEQAWRGEREALTRLVPASELDEHASGYVIHPSVLDATFQTVYIAATAELGAGRTYVPSTLGSLCVSGRGVPVWARAKLRSSTKDAAECDVDLLDEKGDIVGSFAAMKIVALGKAADKLDELIFEQAWRASVPKAPTAPAGTWLLLADEQGVASALRSKLEAGGAKVVTVRRGPGFKKQDASSYEVDPLDPASLSRLVKEAFGRSAPKQVVQLFALDARASAESALDERVARQAQDLACVSTLHLVQALTQAEWGEPPRLFVVTRGCQAAKGSGDVRFPEQALAWGFAATVAHESPEFRTTLIDLDSDGDSGSLLDELTRADDETRVALRKGERFVPRLVRAGRPAAKKKSGVLRSLTVGPNEGYRLDALEVGRTESLTLEPVPVPTPGPGQVVIRTRASGLNFRDVLMVIGLYPGLGDGRPPMGTELAGVVHSVGAGVDRLKPGDEVVAASFYGFDAHVVLSEKLVIKKPASVSFEQAAALPTVLMTVLYGLQEVGRLRKGERILIHAATGGVGLAAVHYAKYVGADVYATAGSEEKRSFLRGLGVQHVYDSRTLDWVDAIKRDTDGRGVDVVLNSLSGEALLKGVSVLAPFGRFVELGKRDIYENSQLGLYGVRNNVTFSAVALDQLMADRPDEARTLLEESFRLVEQGVLPPLPVEAFPISRAAEAFEHIARARHIGKVVLTSEDTVTVRDAGADGIRPDKTYLITGGLGGLGLVVAKRLAKMGAKHVALVGRSAPSEGATKTIRELEKDGVRAYVVRADVAQRSSLESGLAELARSAPAVGGIVHGAGVLDDATLTTLTASRIGPVLDPKVRGTVLLEELLPQLDLRVYFSSITALLGSAGQSHYAAANAFLDAFAHYKVARSQPAISLNWGVWAEVGLAARADRVDNVQRQGLATLSPEDGSEIFARVVGSEGIQLAPVPVDFRQWRQANPQAAGIPLIREVAAATPQRAAPKNSGLVDRLQSADDDAERIGILEEYLRVTIAGILRASASSIPLSAPFKQLGFDSLMMVSLKNVIERDIPIPMSTGTLFAYPTVTKLAAHIVGKLFAKAAEKVVREEPVANEPLLPMPSLQDAEAAPPSVDDLNDAEVAAQLAATLLRLQVSGEDNG